MSSRRTDQRRRRVLMDEFAHNPSADGDELATVAPVARSRAKSGPRRAYSIKAERRHQLKTTDLIPKRWATWLIVIGCLGLGVGLLNLVNIYLVLTPLPISSAETIDGTSDSLSTAARPNPAQNSVPSPVDQATSLVGHNGFAAWYSSLLLILSSLASLQIYALRQHRRNDYRGTYRVWLWFAAILLVCSLNCIVDLHSLCSQGLRHWTGALAWVGTGTGPPMIKLSLLAVIVVRGLIEVRVSPTSLVLVCFVWLAYAAALLMQIPSVAAYVVHDRYVELAQGNAWLAGVTLTLVAALYYARVVYLHAAGLTMSESDSPAVARKSKTKTVKRPPKQRVAASSTDSQPSRARADHDDVEADDKAAELEKVNQTASPLGQLVSQHRSGTANTRGSISVQQSSPGVAAGQRPGAAVPPAAVNTLSKAERRRLKKEKRRAA